MKKWQNLVVDGYTKGWDCSGSLVLLAVVTCPRLLLVAAAVFVTSPADGLSAPASVFSPVLACAERAEESFPGGETT